MKFVIYGIQTQGKLFSIPISVVLIKLSFRIGKLVLNRRNIEKSGAYLNPKRYLESIASRKEITPEEIKGEYINIFKQMEILIFMFRNEKKS